MEWTAAAEETGDLRAAVLRSRAHECLEQEQRRHHEEEPRRRALRGRQSDVAAGCATIIESAGSATTYPS
jgi:hypothetical protein